MRVLDENEVTPVAEVIDLHCICFFQTVTVFPALLKILSQSTCKIH